MRCSCGSRRLAIRERLAMARTARRWSRSSRASRPCWALGRGDEADAVRDRIDAIRDEHR
jgi:hypothetical protein